MRVQVIDQGTARYFKRVEVGAESNSIDIHSKNSKAAQYDLSARFYSHAYRYRQSLLTTVGSIRLRAEHGDCYHIVSPVLVSHKRNCLVAKYQLILVCFSRCHGKNREDDLTGSGR